MRIILLLFWVLAYTIAQATGIKGIVKTIKGEPLPYATVAIKGTSTGTIANAEGRYELTLSPGKYEVVFQYLGFKTSIKSVEITNETLTLNVNLEEQALTINEVRIGSKSEDPAYAICVGPSPRRVSMLFKYNRTALGCISSRRA